MKVSPSSEDDYSYKEDLEQGSSTTLPSDVVESSSNKLRTAVGEPVPPLCTLTTCCICCYNQNWRFYRKSCLVVSSILLFIGTIRVCCNLALLILPISYESRGTLSILVWLDPWSALAANYDGQDKKADDESKKSTFLIISLVAKLVVEIVPAILIIVGTLKTSARSLLIALILSYARFVWTVIDALFIFAVGFTAFGTSFDRFKFTIPEAIYTGAFFAFPFELFTLSVLQGMLSVAR